MESVYSSLCDFAWLDVKVIYKNIQRMALNDNLLYTCVAINYVKTMVDSGSMACTLSSAVVPRLQEAGALSRGSLNLLDVVLVECGSLKTRPEGICELVLRTICHKASVPVLVVDDQTNELAATLLNTYV